MRVNVGHPQSRVRLKLLGGEAQDAADRATDVQPSADRTRLGDVRGQAQPLSERGLGEVRNAHGVPR
jgi:hypothetical protein